jgi:hypothetical protein
MRHGPAKPTRQSFPIPTPGDNENRAGIRALDCGEEAASPVVIRRAESIEPDIAEPRSTLGEQRQSV